MIDTRAVIVVVADLAVAAAGSPPAAATAVRRRSAPPSRRPGGTSSRTMASPSPVPPKSRARASSSRVNRSKTRSRSGAAIPGPSSRHRRARSPGRSTSAASSTAECGVPDGVGHQVVHRPAQLARVGQDHHRSGPGATVHRHPLPRVPAATSASSARPVDRTPAGPAAGCRRRPGPAAAGPRPAPDSRSQVGQQVRRQGAALAEPLGHLDLGAHAGQRPAQLVGRIGHERPLPLPAGGQPVQHPVQGHGQGPDLVGRRRHGQPSSPRRRHRRRAC